MAYYNSAAKLVIVVSTLVLLFGSLPQGHAEVQPQAIPAGLLNIVQFQFTSFLACTPTGNPPSGGGVPGVAGALLSGTCNGASGSLATAFTNATGFAQGILTLAEGIVIDPSRGMPCFLQVRLPLITGTTCTVFPPTGILEATFQLLSVVNNPLGGLVAIVTTVPWVYRP